VTGGGGGGGGGGGDDDGDDYEGKLAVRISYLSTNVFRSTIHYASVVRMCWLLRNRSYERAWVPACSKLRDTDVPRIGRYDETSMQEQLAPSSRMSAAN